jgi:hypothetical protein|tara:strand:+ start:3014 stop:3223 length:210 start_codon:yes stop_codon:yes gene_type:complete
MTWEKIIKIQTEQDKQELKNALEDALTKLDSDMEYFKTNQLEPNDGKVIAVRLSFYKDVFELIKTRLQL